MNQEDRTAEEESISEMIRCPQCRHVVPKQNLALHQALGCGNLAGRSHCNRDTSRHSRVGGDGDELMGMEDDYEEGAASMSTSATSSTVAPQQTSMNNVTNKTGFSPPRSRARVGHGNGYLNSFDGVGLNDIPLTSAAGSDVARASSSESTSNSITELPFQSWDHGIRQRRNRNVKSESVSAGISQEEEEEVVQVGQIVNLADNEEEEEDGEVIEAEWACPRCTLLNPMDIFRCEACNYQNDRYSNRSSLDHHSRRPDVTITDTLIPDMDGTQRSIYSSPSTSTSSLGADRPSPSSRSYVGGGAILGSVVGAARAYAGGRSLPNSMLEGAFSGALGGAIVGEVMRDRNSQTSQPCTTHQTLPSSSVTVVPIPENGHNRNLRVTQQRNALGRQVTTRPTTFQNNANTERSFFNAEDLDTETVHELLRHVLLSSRVQHPYRDIDNMSYEQLLRTFGDGSENRGADATAIAALPTYTIRNVKEELPSDRRQCSICLEEFEAGHKRKVLPCLHGFHEDCIDRWLSSNGSCPICKHVINGQVD